jgi:serpin B
MSHAASMRPVALLLAGLLLAACASGPGALDLVRANVPRQAAPSGDAIAAASAVNAFGFDLLRKIDEHRNAVISPASIAIALGMARAGAKGETATQMDAVLHALASDDHATWLNALDAALASRTGTFKDASQADRDVTLRIANAPFAQKDEAWDHAFLDALAGRFGAGIRLVDYKTAAEPARKAINAWVSDQTEQRIKELLAQGTLDDTTRLVLVNAIYLKAAWQRAFEPSLTKPAAFHRLDGSSVDVPTMHLGTELPYAEGAGWKAVELPYVGGQLAMTIVVPDDLAAFLSAADGETFGAIATALAARQPMVDLAFPTFSTETKTDLADVLAALGMPDAFDPNRADFSGMTTQEPLYISKVVHQANIDVDEKGTTASAATAVVMDASAAPLDHIVLNVDRPFVFALRDVTTGAIVFLGEITDPTPGA